MVKECLLSGVLALTLLTGCTAATDSSLKAAAAGVVTAMPSELQGCERIGFVGTSAQRSLGAARALAKFEAARIGATHIVETAAYSAQVTFYDFGIALEADAYKCPLGAGPRLPAHAVEEN